MVEINFNKIEKKWQKKWKEAKIFECSIDNKKKKYYVLEMFPYPSGDGLHMGHALNYTIGDVIARFKKMNGFNVLHPMGYDALGLPAENAAIKVKIHPSDYTNKSIKNFISQQKSLGISYDWNRIINTADPGYYKWDQWIFLKMFEKCLAYQKQASVNYCPTCKTVLANEQAQTGKCERCETPVEIKHLKQWFLKITDYADELYEEINKLKDWPERTKAMQKNWIGKSHGIEIDFIINNEKWPIFTTRPDTIYGVTFMVISAQHPRLMEITTKEQKKQVENFLKKINTVSQKSIKDLDELNKEGVFTGAYAINPINNEKVPVYAGNFVVADYGSGMVMAVPAHDQRDFLFAKKYKIKIKQVIAPLIKTKEGADAIREDKKTITRDSIYAIVKHWRENKFLCLNWNKEFGWKTLIVGGIEKNETPKEAAMREVIEETGYCDIKDIKPLDFEIHSNFFAIHKDINRYGKYKVFLVELKSDKRKKTNIEHTKNHKSIWIEKEKVNKFLNIKNYLITWNNFINENAYTDSGVLINSEEFNGLENDLAKEKITNKLEKLKKGRRVVNFRLRDWLISRQRYWGTPIPIIHCEKCGAVPVPEKDLPVVLPKKVEFGEGNPLLTNKKWLNVKCPKCNGNATRESDTMDTFANSSWYFLRYTDPNNDKEIFNTKNANYWCPIDEYIGGAEHACMHLIYFRFYTKFLNDLKLINFREPAKKLFHQGMLHGEGGIKMSKSKGNVVNPETVSKKYGIDTARYFLLSLAEPDKPRDWSEKGIQGSMRFIKKIFDTFNKIKIGKTNEKTEILLNKTIEEITKNIEEFKYRMATIKLKELFENLNKETEAGLDTLEKSLKLLSPICPHISEELFEKINGKEFISNSSWPRPEKTKSEQNKKELDLNQKIVDNIEELLKKIGKKEKVFVYLMPFEVEKTNKEKIQKGLNQKLEVNIYAVNDKNKYDPNNKAKNAKPGLPSIFIE